MLTGAIVALMLFPATPACLYYTVGAIVGRLRRRLAPRTPTLHIGILIPAHNEESTLPAALASIAAADYPRALIGVRVVVDHCSDRTEELARTFGAECTIRRDSPERGKGPALAAGLADFLPSRPDGVLILDADCRISPGLLKRLDGERAAGASAVQVAVISTIDSRNSASVVAAVGAAFDNRMAAAADRLHRFVPLRGTGMFFAREVLERHPWTDFGLAEDAEYAAELHRHGVRIRFAAEESVTCEAPPREAAFFDQRRRWSAALRVPRSGRAFTSKPVILAHLAATIAASLILGELWAIAWALALAILTAATYADVMRGVGVRRPGFRSVWLVGRLATVAIGSLWRREKRWLRTPR